jgi:hypothetical protein
MVVPFARHVSEQSTGYPDGVPVLQVELKTERFVMAFRLLLGCTFIRAESEQNSSHPLRAPFVQHALAWFSDAQLNVAQLIGLRPERKMLKSRSI